MSPQRELNEATETHQIAAVKMVRLNAKVDSISERLQDIISSMNSAGSTWMSRLQAWKLETILDVASNRLRT